MARTVLDWDDAAADTYTYFNAAKRGYPTQRMLALVDDLAIRGSATQADLMAKHGSADFIATTIGHVTTAIHGKGAVPKEGGWYTAISNPYTYRVSSDFVTAWKKKRRLGV